MAPKPFNPLEFLKLAEKLAEESSEASHRSAVSRAYYGIFLHVRERLNAAGHFTPTRSPQDHKGVAKKLEALGSLPLSRKMISGRVIRGKADYDLLPRVSQKQAELQCREARDIEKHFSLLEKTFP